MRRITVFVATLIAVVALAPPASLARGGEESFVGAWGYVTPDGDLHLIDTLGVFAGDVHVASSSCSTTYCARFKPGLRDRRATVTVTDDANAKVLFAVGQDRNRDGDAIDADEYSLHCGVGSTSVRPKKNLDIQVLYGAYEVGGVMCVNTPVSGTITADFSR